MRNLKFISVIFIFSGLLACNSRENDTTSDGEDSILKTEEGSPFLSFDSKINELGTISEGEQVIAWFTYNNEGDAPLLIQNIEAGCGCTIPSWNKRPLAPGEEESIKVIFNSRGKNGIQNIRVSVFSNARNAQEDLRIKANVISNL